MAHQCRRNAHVKDIRAEGQQAAILEEQGLQGDHTGHHQHPGPGAEEQRRERAAEKVAGGAAEHGKVEHLSGKDKGSHYPHQGYPAFVESLHALHGDGQRGNGQHPPQQGYRRGEKAVWNVHTQRHGLAKGLNQHTLLLRVSRKGL